LKTPGDFVSDPTARDLFKRRLRYTAARWASYPSLGVWEWWNEINWTPINDEALVPWITEMTKELQKYDPYNHLRSTSYANGIDNKIWSMPELDFAQQHDYSASDPASMLSQNLAKIQKNSGEKPALLAEHGNSDDGNTPFNNGLWAAPFSGYASTAMYWWWDNYIDPSNLWFQYKGISEFMKGEDLTKMTPSQVETSPSGGIVSILSRPDHALIWVRDDNYNMHGTQLAYYKDKNPGSNWIYLPAPLEGLSFTINSLQDGAYLATWYSTIDGLPTAAPLVITVKDGSVTINVPRFQIDLALKIVKAP
jgi:hypothetical protein